MLHFIGQGLDLVKKRLGKKKLLTFDVFSGSGVVSRFFKQHSQFLYTNDLEPYAALINECYLTNQDSFNYREFSDLYNWMQHELQQPLQTGFITQLYAPGHDDTIVKGERVFYTRRNAQFLDTARQLIMTVAEPYQKFFLGPLLSEASIHANTAGVFKGFYKNSTTGIGQFGGKNQDALHRIKGHIELQYPVFSNFTCEYQVYNGDANAIYPLVPEVDVAYLDPPYNQHPYGSNYFMLNVLLDYKKPEHISKISGIPVNWQRSRYNQRQQALAAIAELAANIKAKFLLISFNSEGFISSADMQTMLGVLGPVTVLETGYNTFRGSRNLAGREKYVKEYLYLVEKRNN